MLMWFFGPCIGAAASRSLAHPCFVMGGVFTGKLVELRDNLREEQSSFCTAIPAFKFREALSLKP